MEMEQEGKKKGLIHLYYGDGKGKTTAAAGLAMRAAGRGKKVMFAQFMKGNLSGEVMAMEAVPQIHAIRNQKDLGFVSGMSREEKEELKRMHGLVLNQVLEEMEKGIQMVILDEITYPYTLNLIDRRKVEKLILNKPEEVELVLTGRNPDEFFLENADYITQMCCIRHPYKKGTMAREGIEY